MTWQSKAACRGADPDLFFPGKGELITEPLSYCNRCPVRSECLEYALSQPDLIGVWGGASARERHRMRARAAS